MGLLDPPSYSRAAADARYTRGAPWLTLPYGWDATWKAAKAAQASTPARLLWHSDSIFSGQGSTNWITQSVPGLVRQSLIDAGNTLSGDYYPAYTFGVGNGLRTGTSPYTTLASGGSTPDGGYGRCVIYPASQATSTAFTSPYACTQIDLFYVDYASGTWTYSVDGGAAVTVTCTGPGNQSNATCRKVTITGLANTAHSVVIGSASAANVLMLNGIACYANPAAGIAHARLTYPGIRFGDWLQTRGGTTGTAGVSTFPTDRIALLQGQNPGGDAPTTPTGFGFPTQPHLTVIEVGVNDCTQGVPVRLFEQAFRRAIAAVRRGVDAASIVIVAAANPDGIYTDAAPAFKGTEWHKYKNVMREMAHVYSCAYVDIDAKWGSTPFGKGFMVATSDIHPLQAGHTDMATVLASIL